MIPIIVGVTGHRDILPQDELKLRNALQTKLLALKNQFPHSPFHLLSGLAEGADQLAAEAALDAGYKLVATLPMPQAMYVEDFNTPALLTQFQQLLAKADQVLVCPVENSDDIRRDERYQALGRYIAQHAQIVIAVWDGITEQLAPDGQLKVLMGGTADVVQLCRGELAASALDILTIPEAAKVEHLRTRRAKHNPANPPMTEQLVGTWAEPTDEQAQQTNIRTDRMLKAIDQLNEYGKTVPTASITQCQEWLLSGNPPSSVTSILATPIAAFALADAAAGIRQKERAKAVKRISLLAIASILCQQIYSGPDMQWGWLAAHIGLAALAFWAFLHFFRGRHRREEQYLDWRSIAEGLRVQVFWRAAGVNDSVADHYLTGDRDELDWIRQAVRNMTIGMQAIDDPVAMQWVREAWLQSQKKYFEKKVPENSRHRVLFNRLTQGFFFTALTVTAVTLAAHLLDMTDTVLNSLVLVSGMSFVMAAVLKTYSEQMAYEEQQNRYRGMAGLFNWAIERYDALMREGKIADARLVLLKIGQEALAENAGWLRLHRERQFEINIA